MQQKKLIVIAGPTAVGKTSLALNLAQRLQTEIISADSRQIFKELKIGTAKPTEKELAMVPHHFINIKSIDEEYDAGQFGRDALVLVNSLFKQYDNLLVCGGSGLYIKSLTEGFDDMPVIPEGVREEINQSYREKGLAWLQERVQEADPEYYAMLDKQNPHRLIRALEIYLVSGRSVGAWRNKEKRKHEFQILKIGIELSREDLYKRIDTRMDEMIAVGLFEEAEQFFPQRNEQALQTVGYREIFGFLEGLYDKEEAIRLLKRNTRHYAKRQLTWFKKDKEINWFFADQVEEIYNFIVQSKSGE